MTRAGASAIALSLLLAACGTSAGGSEPPTSIDPISSAAAVIRPDAPGRTEIRPPGSEHALGGIPDWVD